MIVCSTVADVNQLLREACPTSVLIAQQGDNWKGDRMYAWTSRIGPKRIFSMLDQNMHCVLNLSWSVHKSAGSAFFIVQSFSTFPPGPSVFIVEYNQMEIRSWDRPWYGSLILWVRQLTLFCSSPRLTSHLNSYLSDSYATLLLSVHWQLIL